MQGENLGELREPSVALRCEWTLSTERHRKTHNMEIRIHTPSGSVETFVQDNPALVAAILKGIQSTKVFASNIITIAGDYSLTTFIASRVNRVDLITNDLALGKYPTDILDVIELSGDEFRERSHLNDPARLERRRLPKKAGELAVFFVEVEMTGGNVIFLAAETAVGLKVERLHRLRMLFSAPAVHFRLRQGGLAFLNLKNLVQVTFLPGPDVTPSDAWPAHHLSGQRGSVSRADVPTLTIR